MSLDISSFENRLNNLAYAGKNQRSVKENTQTGPKASTLENFDTDEEKPVSKETGVQDQLVFFSANHKVNLRINPETQDIIINIVDSESGEVVRQIPGEGFLELKHRITEFNQKILDELT
jgi:uncharacterized FlaG/YvyC family protein